MDFKFAGYIITALVFMLLLLLSIIIRLVIFKREVERAWRNIDMFLRMRHDKISMLTAVCREQMGRQDLLLTRADTLVLASSRALLSTDVNTILASEELLSSCLKKIFIKAKDFPLIKYSQSFIDISYAIQTLEDTIAHCQVAYNKAVDENNAIGDTFPHFIVANICNHVEFTPYRIRKYNLTSLKVKKHS